MAAPRSVAFLRAINVGGRVVKMDRLRALFGDLGLTNIETFIASGNVIFDSSQTPPQALERKIEQHLEEHLGYTVATLVRPVTALASITTSHPFGDLSASPHSLLVGFHRTHLTPDVARAVAALETATDTFHSDESQLYWLCKTRISDSKITNVALERAMGGSPVTFRNMTTVRKLAAKAAVSSTT